MVQKVVYVRVMKHFFLFLLFLIVSLTSFSQVLVDVNSMVTDIKTGKSESGVSVKIYDGGTVVAQGVTPSNGKLILIVPAEKKYKVEFSKSGKVTRFVMINAMKIDVELLQGASDPYALIEMSMFEETPNVDYSYIKNNPITEFYFDGKAPKLAFNTSTANNMKKEVDRVLASAASASGNNEAQYQAKMKEGEALALQKKYAEAATKFEQALGFKKDDKLAMKRLDEMDKLDKANQISTLDGQAANAEFDNLVKAAEILKSQKKWQEAIDKYEEAYLKKKDQGVDDEINALMEIIRKEKKEKEAEGAYTAAMTAGDNLMKQKSYLPARDQYVLALKAKPNDPVATKKKADVDLLIEAAKGAQEKKKLFDNTVTEADELYKLEKWAEAKAKYEDALKLESASTYVAGRITDTKAKIEAAEKERLKQEQITKLIAEGSAAITAEQWDPALLKFNEVTKLDPENTTAKEKLVLIKAKIEEQKQNAALEANFKKLVDEGDVLAKGSKFPEALVKYEAAELVKKDPTLSQKIATTKAEIEKAKNQKELKEKFDLAMKEGEALIAASKWEDAKVKFIEASTLDDKAQAPKDKIKFVEDKMLAEQSAKQKTENYQAAMSKGEKLFGEGKLLEARVEFDAASKIDPIKTEPKDKILKIDNQLKAEAAQKEKADKYTAAMKAGDDLRLAGKLTEAKAEYTKAKGIDGTQTEPDVKIKEVEDQILAESSAKSAKEKADKYAAAMNAGNDLRAAGKLTEAKAEYTKAKGIDGTQTEPDVKIKEVDDQILAESSAKTAKEKADKYAAEIKAGDNLRKAGKLADARDEYSKAKNTDPANPLADVKIKEVEAEIANLNSSMEKKKQVEDLMKVANELFVKEDFEGAIAKYDAVLAIDKQQAEAAKKKADAEAKLNAAKGQAEMEAAYLKFKSEGIEANNQERWYDARASFSAAKKIKTDAELESKLKEVELKIASIEAEKNNEEAYKTLMQEANDLAMAKKYDAAIKKYQDASNKKPLEKTPQEKIESLMVLKQQDVAQQQIDAKYNDAMKKGNDAMTAEDFPLAIKYFNEANGIKQSEKEPVDKANQARERYEAQNLDFKIKYEKMLDAAQKFLDEGNWEKATNLYNRAKDIKKDDPLPNMKLAEIEEKKKAEEANKLLLAEKEKAFNAKMEAGEKAFKAKEFDQAILLFTEAKKLNAESNLPDARIEASNLEKSKLLDATKENELYAQAISAGDAAVKIGEYNKALAEYTNALKIKKGDKVAQDKLNEVAQIIDNQTNAAEEQKKKEAWTQQLNEADNLFKASQWTAAKEKYDALLKIQPKDSYLKAQKTKCIENEKKQAEQQKNYAKLLADAETSFKAGDLLKAKSLFEKAHDQNKNDQLPIDRLGEIDALLNPKVITSGPLANLGTPTDNSILEGQALLAKADNERKNRTTTTVSSQSDEIQKVVVAQANSKDEKIKDLSLELQEGAKQRELDAPSDDENRLEIVNNVKKNQQVLSEKASSDDKFENAESFDAISKMELEKSVIEKNTTEKTAVYASNKSIVEKAALILQDAEMANQDNELNDGFKAKKILDTTVQIVAENTIQDDELRKLTEQGVRVSQESVVKLDAEKQITEAESNQKITDEVVKNNALKSNLDIESMKVVDHNVEVMDVVDAGVRELSNANQTRHVEKTLETQTRISNEIVTLSTKDGERDNNRKEAVEVLKKEDNELTEAQRAQYNALYLKTLDTRNTITTEVNKDYGVNREKDEALIAQTAVIQEKGNKALAKSVTESQSDEGQRYLAKSTVSEKETQIAVLSTEKNGQSAANKEILNKSEKELLNVDKKAQESQVQKNLDARKLIEKIESKQIVFDAKAANEIGKNYPEGVSQESFNQNGTDGLPVAIITRRIVVTNGYGAVYVRKQTLTGLTYSKNGEPSTEYIWQKETSDGKLVKNF